MLPLRRILPLLICLGLFVPLIGHAATICYFKELKAITDCDDKGLPKCAQLDAPVDPFNPKCTSDVGCEIIQLDGTCEEIKKVPAEEAVKKKKAPEAVKPAAAAPKVITIPNPLGTISIPVVLGRIINTFLGFVGSVALLMFVYGGFVWITSGGSPERISQGKNILVWATIGLVFIFASYAVLNFILGALSA